jgi:hypothetical protein
MKLSLLAIVLVACGGYAAESSARSPSGRGTDGSPAASSAAGAASSAPAGSGAASAAAALPDASWIAAGPAFDAQSPFASSAGLDGIAKKLEGASFVKLGNGRQKEAWDVHGWDKQPAKCVLTKDAFEVKADFGGKVDVRGDVMLSDDPDLLKAVKVANLGEGTAKLAE